MSTAETTNAATAATVAAQAAKGKPTGAHKATPAKKAAKAAAKAKPAKPARPKADGPRPGSKGAKVLELVARPKGATAAEIMKATKWQAHTIRGFLSIAGKKYGLKIESTKNDAGDRVYKSR